MAGVSLQGLFLSTGLFFTSVGAVCFWNRFPDDDSRFLQRTAGVVLGLCASYQLWMAWTGGIHSYLAMRVVNPALVAHGVLDLLCDAPVVMSLGYIAGRTPLQMLRTTAIIATGHASLMVAAATPSAMRATVLFLIGVPFMTEGTTELTHELPRKAAALGDVNVRRAQMGTDLVAFSWFVVATAEFLAMVHVLPLNFALPCIVACDMVGKMGGCHIIMNKREAVVAANQHALEDSSNT
uniref:Uncharacterized protein n=1 Tax=Alexandrium catenella TaxID=2925 RepID=A0A7S1LIW9_ALECA